MFESNIKQPCPICGKQIPEIRPIVFNCPDHGEFTMMEIDRSKFTKKPAKTAGKNKKVI